MLSLALGTVHTLFNSKLRKGNGAPYSVHLMSCLGIVCSYGGKEVTQVAALFHDSVEDAGFSYEAIEQDYGPEVTNIVRKLTEKKKKALSWHARKQQVIDLAGICCQGVGIVLIADKLDNLQSFVRDLSRYSDPQDYWSKFNAGFTDQLWFYQSLCRALCENRRLIQMIEHPDLRTYYAIAELMRVFEVFRDSKR